ncbi:MAG: hypothetical protein M3Q89_13510 [Verrucomicrobiota bacterium]|nr:hypothetical protein [Verrucomicrobiota bacterium]
MKSLLTLVSLLALVSHAMAAPKTVNGRTIENIDVIPPRVLKGAISPKFYETLRISPIQGQIMVRAELVGTRLFGARVVKSDLGGAYDALALERAQEIRLLRHFKLDSQNPMSPILLHLLIYKIADGTMALSFANLAGPGDEQLDYFGCAKLAVLKDDGLWTEIKGPSSLQGKGTMVRATGVKNNLQAIYILERIPGR